MKIAVSASQPVKESEVNPQFGRCPHFIIFDTITNQYEVLENTAAHDPMGAGTKAAALVHEKGATVVLTGRLGPKAVEAFRAAGMQVVDQVSGTVVSAISRLTDGTLTPHIP